MGKTESRNCGMSLVLCRAQPQLRQCGRVEDEWRRTPVRRYAVLDDRHTFRIMPFRNSIWLGKQWRADEGEPLLKV